MPNLRKSQIQKPVASVSSNTTINLNHVGGLVEVTADSTITLDTLDIPNGAMIIISDAGGRITLEAGTATLNGDVLTTSAEDECLVLVYAGGDVWDVLSGGGGESEEGWEIADLSDFSYGSDMYALSGVASERGIAFNPNGSQFFIGDTTQDDTTEFDTATPWVLAGSSLGSTTSVIGSDVEDVLADIFIEPSGTYAFAIGGNDTIYRFTLSSTGDAISATYDGASFDYDYSSITTNAGAIYISPDGGKLLLQENGTGGLFLLNFGAAFNPATLTNPSDSNLGLGGSGVYANPQGTQLFVLTNTKVLKKYTTTDFSPSSAVDTSQDLDLSSVVPTSTIDGFTMKPDDGTKFYVVRGFPSEVYAWELGT